MTASAKNQIIKGIMNSETDNVEFEEIHLNRMKISHCMACGNGWGTCRSDGKCAINDELTHMGMRAYDRIPVNRYNKDYILPALEQAGAIYVERLKNGFDMYY